MSRSQKVTLAVLALIALAFVLLTVRGLAQPGCEGDEQACARGYSPGGMKKLGSLFGSSAAARAELPQQRYEMPQAARREMEVASAAQSIRTLKLQLPQGTARLSLVNRDGARDIDLSPQEEATQLPREADGKDEQDPRGINFAVTGGGGTLAVQCTVPPCVLEVR